LRLLEIGKRLVANGHSVHVICGMTEPRLPKHESIDGIEVHYIRLLSDSFFRFRKLSFYLSRYLFYVAVSRLHSLISDIAPDIVIDYVSPAPSLVYPLTKKMGVRCYAEVMEYRGNQWFQFAGFVTALLGWGSQFLLRIFEYDQIISISEFTKYQLEQAGFASDKIRVVPCGIDLEAFRIGNPPKRKRNSLVMVSRLVPVKGHVHLFDALAHVRERIPDVQLWVVGDGPARSELERYVLDRQLEKNVHFAGRVTDEEKARLLHTSTVFVSSSLVEGFGIVLLEAMACGLPIVAFDLPVYREFMDSQCGFLVAKGNDRLMAKQILRLLEDDETRKRMAAHNLSHVKRFDWDRVAEVEEKLLTAQLR